jgi:hypothetical protein
MVVVVAFHILQPFELDLVGFHILNQLACYILLVDSFLVVVAFDNLPFQVVALGNLQFQVVALDILQHLLVVALGILLVVVDILLHLVVVVDNLLLLDHIHTSYLYIVLFK